MKQRLVYWLVARFYNYLASRDRDAKVAFMNYGFAWPESRADASNSSETDSEVRRKALYRQISGGISPPEWDWSQKDILEVGSGRGGGADYLSVRLEPRTYQGVDLSSKAVRFCQERYFRPGLRFSQGNAESLAFADQSFDVVINLESSHCYPRMPKFLEEVSRVLRPQGYLLLADFRRKEGMTRLQEHLRDSGLVEISREDITANVLAALRLDGAANLALVQQYIP
ncbi:MAG: class I SAM-dependent methyltransferase, partial [Dehalococcoidia bacterium]